MSHHLSCRISNSLWDALRNEAKRTGQSISHVVQRALATELDLEHHSIFQVSTSGAVVGGIFQGCTTIGDVKRHGDLGIGTFEDLDGEMIMLDGRCFRASAGGTTEEVDDWRQTPFAVATRFSADLSASLDAISCVDDLYQKLDGLRPSENIFVGLRLDGVFNRIDLRAALPAMPGEDLVSATAHQSEFSFDNIKGTLVGFWTPTYARSLNVAGYHLHFLSADQKFGGHLLGLEADALSVALHLETDLHLILPENAAFLEADLRDDPTGALDIAEKTSVRDRQKNPS